MVLYNNGIVIQGTNIEEDWYHKISPTIHTTEFEVYKSYKGVGRYLSWPLEREDDDISKSLTQEADNRWFSYFYGDSNDKYVIKAAPNKEYCLRYLSHCREKGINTRVLFCKTDREVPLWESEVPQLEFLGYDIAASQDLSSPIPEDLLLDPEPKYMGISVYNLLSECREFLNRNKLFSNEKDILTYIERRKNIIASDIEWKTGPNSIPMYLVEPDSDFCIFHLSEVIGDL